MPRPPNDSEEGRPAGKPKRARRTSKPRRSGSGKPRRSQSGMTHAELLAQCPPEKRQAIEMMFSLHPKQMLAFIILAVLPDRVTTEELHFICDAYHSAVIYWELFQD